MAQFVQANIPGQFQAGQQAELSRQSQVQQFGQNQFNAEQNKINAPIKTDQARANLLATQQSNAANSELSVFTRNVNTALELQSTPDEEKATFLMARIEEGELLGRDMSQSKKALEMVNSGQLEELKKGSQDLIDVGEKRGIIKQTVRPTASSQDFETFKQLTAKANKTKDPIDIQLAEQFGRQSGFDRETPEELANIEVEKTSKIALVKQAAAASKEAFDSLKGVRLTIANIDDAVKALDKGAETGPIISKLPSFRQASIELDNIRGRMGLDVVGATTFGALSESELAFALNVALPDSLEPVALKDWLIRKKDAQTKLANELRKAASFLGTPGNTIADFLAKQEKENPDVANLSDDELFN